MPNTCRIGLNGAVGIGVTHVLGILGSLATWTHDPLVRIGSGSPLPPPTATFASSIYLFDFREVRGVQMGPSRALIGLKDALAPLESRINPALPQSAVRNDIARL